MEREPFFMKLTFQEKYYIKETPKNNIYDTTEKINHFFKNIKNLTEFNTQKQHGGGVGYRR